MALEIDFPVRILANWALALALASPLGAPEEHDQPPDPPNEEEEKEESAPRVRIYWDDGLHIVGLNRNFTTFRRWNDPKRHRVLQRAEHGRG